MEHIADEAGLGVATLYRHFGDRDSLIRAFLQRYTPQRAFQEVALRGGDFRADLVHLVTEMLTFLHRNRDMIWLGLVEGEETQRLLARLQEVPGGMRADITRFLEAAAAQGRLQDRNPEQMATALGGMLAAFALELPVFGATSLQDPHQTAEFIVGLFLDGVKSTVIGSEESS
jgi:AcrR family transcriptional regulator